MKKEIKFFWEVNKKANELAVKLTEFQPKYTGYMKDEIFKRLVGILTAQESAKISGRYLELLEERLEKQILQEKSIEDAIEEKRSEIKEFKKAMEEND